MVSRSGDYVECRRETATHLQSLHDLAWCGGGKEAIAASIHRRIVGEVGPAPENDLVDIGGGDGTLPRLAGQIGVRSAAGFLARHEEVACAKATGLNVQQAYGDQLPLPDASASVVVCNNVLRIVPRDKILASLCEMHYIARPGARIFIAEIPLTPGPPPEPQFDSSGQTLAYLYRSTARAPQWGGLAEWCTGSLPAKPMVIRDGSQASFYARAGEFITLACDAGLTPVHHWRHEYPNTRNNCLFSKPA